MRGFGNPVLDIQFQVSDHKNHLDRVRQTRSIVSSSLQEPFLSHKLNKEKTWQNEEYRLQLIER